MGYLHINNLYKDKCILEFRECYALEKIHGTSAHIKHVLGESGKDGELTFFSGGEKHERFVKLFDQTKLIEAFRELGRNEVTIYGEAYGGKQQAMADVYGPDLRFVVFDVMIDGTWLSVPQAEAVTKRLGLEFVAYEKGPATIEWLNQQRDLPCRQSKRNGIEGDKIGEGIVARPLFELIRSDGSRVICKHKTPEFSERRSKRDVQAALEDTLDKTERPSLIALEWVTRTRLEHVLDKLKATYSNAEGVKATVPLSMKDTQRVIEAMQEDVNREGLGEFKPSEAVNKAIAGLTVRLYKAWLQNQASQS